MVRDIFGACDVDKDGFDVGEPLGAERYRQGRSGGHDRARHLSRGGEAEYKRLIGLRFEQIGGRRGEAHISVGECRRWK